MNTPPPGAPPKLWLVVLPTGERHFIDKPMIDGIEAWAKGSNVTVLEYRFAAVVHVPSKSSAVPPSTTTATETTVQASEVRKP